MAAVPIYVWNGTAWQETGPTIPASPIKYQASAPSSPSTGDIWVDSDGDVTTGSQQFQRFRFVASGGETTISGADANGAVLAYTAGLEQVVLNGAVLVRGHDYTATNGTSITGLSPALVASDVLEVFSFIAFTVANTYTQAQVDGLIAAAPGMKLLVPTSADNGTVGATGAVTFSAVSSVSLNDVFSSTYENYRVVYSLTGSAASWALIRLRVSSADNSTSNYKYRSYVGNYLSTATDDTGKLGLSQTSFPGTIFVSTAKGAGSLEFYSPQLTENTIMTSQNAMDISNGYTVLSSGIFGASTSFTGFSLISGSGTITGTVRVYGYKN